MLQYFDKIISKYWCGFRKAFNAQHYLITMIENPRENVDKGDGFGALLTAFHVNLLLLDFIHMILTWSH